MKHGSRPPANLRVGLRTSFSLSETIIWLGKRHHACHSRRGIHDTLRAGVEPHRRAVNASV